MFKKDDLIVSTGVYNYGVTNTHAICKVVSYAPPGKFQMEVVIQSYDGEPYGDSIFNVDSAHFKLLRRKKTMVIYVE